MSEGTAHKSLPDDAHTDAEEAFVDRAWSRHGSEIGELYVFGSAIRGDAHGRASDVDVLIVLDDDNADRVATADLLRDITLDVMIEYGPAVELHILSETTFERHQREQNPFSAPSSPRGRSYARRHRHGSHG